jgi:hypothetical protein
MMFDVFAQVCVARTTDYGHVAVHAPWAETFSQFPICGKPAVNLHDDGDQGKTYLCAEHWDEYQKSEISINRETGLMEPERTNG